MPHKKVTPDTGSAKPPPADQAQQDSAQQAQAPDKESAIGLTGCGAESVLVHLKEQEKTRGRKTDRR
jgi:hypothetical protein